MDKELQVVLNFVGEHPILFFAAFYTACWTINRAVDSICGTRTKSLRDLLAEIELAQQEAFEGDDDEDDEQAKG